jgi:hypothetical protein
MNIANDHGGVFVRLTLLLIFFTRTVSISLVLLYSNLLIIPHIYPLEGFEKVHYYDTVLLFQVIPGTQHSISGE